MQNSKEEILKNKAKRTQGLRGLAISFIGIAIMLAIGSLLLHQLQPLASAPLAKNWKEASNRVILKVNGQVVTEREWVIQYQKLRQDPGNQAKLEQEIQVETLAYLIRDKALLAEALRKGFPLDEGEARTYTEEQRKALQSSPETSEERALFDKFLKGLGISEEEYWRQIAPQIYLLLLPQMHLKEQLYANFPAPTLEELDSYKKEHPESESLSEAALAQKARDEEFEKYWKNYTADLIRTAQIEILAKDLKEIENEALKTLQAPKTSRAFPKVEVGFLSVCEKV